MVRSLGAMLLEQALLRTGTSQTQFSVLLDVHQTTVSRWIRGEIVPSFTQAAEIARVLPSVIVSSWAEPAPEAAS